MPLLSDLQFQSLFQAMSKRIEARASDFAFIQARVCAESFVRNECALAAFEFLRAYPYHVHMEKRLKKKTIDLLIVPIEEDKEEWSRAYEFELKMAWPGGHKGNVSGVQKDLGRLRERRTNSWALVLYFAIESSSAWLPYKGCDLDFQRGIERFIHDVQADQPTFKGNPSHFFHEGVSGNAMLLAWKAST